MVQSVVETVLDSVNYPKICVVISDILQKKMTLKDDFQRKTNLLSLKYEMPFWKTTRLFEKLITVPFSMAKPRKLEMH